MSDAGTETTRYHNDVDERDERGRPRVGSVIWRASALGLRGFVVTEIVQCRHARGYVLTPIPEGMTAQDLGVRFAAAQYVEDPTDGVE